MSGQIDRLYKAVLKAKHTDPASSRTALLLRAGRGKIGKEVGEETAEVIIEAMQKHRHAVLCGSADLLYNLTVLWAWRRGDFWTPPPRFERSAGERSAEVERIHSLDVPGPW